MLTAPLMTTPLGDAWAVTRARGLVMPFGQDVCVSPVSHAARQYDGIGASKNGNTTRPMGLGGSAG